MSVHRNRDFEKEETTDEEDRDSIKKDCEYSKRKVSKESDDDINVDNEQKPPKMLVPNRVRRSNAGNRMAELLESTNIINDTFYSEAYGGFVEDEQDDNYNSPMHSSEEDEVDSDFDAPEQEDESINADDEENCEKKEKKSAKKKLLDKHKVWAVARFNRLTVHENSCDARTQKQRLIEAKTTAKLNSASLKRFEEFELERRKRQSKQIKIKKFDELRITYIQRSDGNRVLILPEVQKFKRPEQRKFPSCAVTGKPAKYKDPCTNLPYADISAFKLIRQNYISYLENLKMQNSGSNGSSVNGTK